MKSARILLGLLLLFTITVANVEAAGAKKLGLSEFLNYLTDNKESLQYRNVEQNAVKDQTEVRVYCTDVTQRKLIEVIDRYDTEKYRLEMTSPDNVVFIALFRTQEKAGSAPKAEKCPGRVKVLAEKINPQMFNEYARFSGQASTATAAVKSPGAGIVSEVKVAQGAAVEKNQELAVINKNLPDDLKKLQAEAARRKQILETRKKWKVKNEKAIQSAEAGYREALATVEKRKSFSLLTIAAPIAGTVKSLNAASGKEISEGAVLFEIENSAVMTATLAVPPNQLGLFTKGENVAVNFKDIAGEVPGVVADVSETGAVLVFDNAAGRITPATEFTLSKLRKEYENAVVVAADKIQKDDIGSFVYVVDVKEARKVYVTPGPIEGNRALILSGLSPDQEIILSGFDCLRDGKKIKLMNAPKEEEVVLKPVKTEKVEKAEKVEKTEKTAKADLSRFRIGAIFEQFNLNDKNLTTYYGHKYRNLPGVELSIHTMFNIDLWASYKVYTDEQKTSFYGNTVKFKLTPLSIGLRYRPLKWKFVEPFVGAGANFYSYSETISNESNLENTKDKASGFFVQGGSYFHANRFLLGEIFLKYNSVKKTLATVLPDGTNSIDFGGLEIGIGLVIKF
jgi:RND family efflux transporter MFP subunit